MVNCTICGKPITLVPSARDRARKYGGTAKDYERMFTAHSWCVVAKRDAEVRDLMRAVTTGGNHD